LKRAKHKREAIEKPSSREILPSGENLDCKVARLIKSQLNGVQPNDPPTLVGVITLLMTVAFLAAWMPARRASRVDPAVALRME
jgi:ABC-type lipoprotein release transport system permease subunit